MLTCDEDTKRISFGGFISRTEAVLEIGMEEDGSDPNASNDLLFRENEDRESYKTSQSRS